MMWHYAKMILGVPYSDCFLGGEEVIEAFVNAYS